jgi:uncharacterized membrane protein
MASRWRLRRTENREILRERYCGRDTAGEVLRERYCGRDTAGEILRERYCGRDTAGEILRERYCGRGTAGEILRERYCGRVCRSQDFVRYTGVFGSGYSETLFARGRRGCPRNVFMGLPKHQRR